jgi:NAD(P)-dependent dehydrogenase (short-subunit alcohol dehydrogenase family)
MIIKDLEGKVIVVTGGAGLLGSNFCKSIALEGGIPIIADINIDEAKKREDELNNELNLSCVDSIKLDINSKESVTNATETILKKYQRIDALVNNAYPRNKNYGNDFFKVDYQDFIENVNLNVGGYFLTSQIFAKFFKLQGYGNIINIASIYGVIPPKFEIYSNTEMTMPVEYAVIKSSIIHFTKYLAKYLANTNIRVNSLSPGGIISQQPEPFIDAYNKKCLTKGMLNPEDISGTLIFLLSGKSTYMNGQNIITDDGFSL